MVFSSIEFLFVFLPAFFLAYNCLPFKNLTYVLFSLFFYFVGEGWYSLVVVASVVVNYGVGLLVDAQPRGPRRKLSIALGLSINLLSLLFFKYAGFVWTTMWGKDASAWMTSIHLPLGISFFTFHAISYLIDVYRHDAKAERSFVRLSLYMLMFPQLIAGPILRFHTVARQLKRRVITSRHVHFGFLLFCVGLGQKVLIADTLASVIDPLFAQSATISSVAAWVAAVSYSFQILFDFSGYSNMAIGLGWMTGFSLPRNFDEPYSSQSITEFWRRWHMSLSRWFRDYFYIPLGGNRLGAIRAYTNLAIVFLACGLWHGANWTFVLWGAYHGAWLVVERLGWSRILERLPRLARHLYALLVVLVGWVLFRADSIGQAGHILSKMVVPSSSGMLLSDVLSRGQAAALLGAVLFCIPGASRRIRGFLWVVMESPLPRRAPQRAYVLGACVGLLVFGAAAVNILAGSYNSFIYFRF
jgi:alginate O-acetyltransferase complex protein AlgI